METAAQSLPTRKRDTDMLRKRLTLLERRLEDFAKPGETPVSTPMMITPWTDVAIGVELAAFGFTGATTAAAWPSANRAIGVPFRVDEQITVQKPFWHNGGTASNNVDVGIYNENFIRQWSMGSYPVSTMNLLQAGASDSGWKPTILVPGRYYMVMAVDSVTPTFFRTAVGVENAKALGMFQMASAFPLPAVLAPAVISSAYLPYFGLSLRTLVV